tara:strand:+ start:288 stop:491 length:204 start_codon:yes stop_codon:yes gene_type:complete
MIKICKRCGYDFAYGANVPIRSLRGLMTRKYCDDCIILQHKDESRTYQAKLRAKKNFVSLQELDNNK